VALQGLKTAFYRFLKGLGAKSGWLLSASNNFNIAPMGD
jgi:hypothetical protein